MGSYTDRAIEQHILKCLKVLHVYVSGETENEILNHSKYLSKV